MRIARIKDSYLFKGTKKDGIHPYALYYDRPTKRYRAVALTHLYVKDEKRFKQVKKGNIRIEKFKEFDVPSGVKNYYYDKTITGKKIDLSDNTNVVKIENRNFSKAQSERIKKFAKYDCNSSEYKKKSRR